jgi:hypothetical protein
VLNSEIFRKLSSLKNTARDASPGNGNDSRAAAAAAAAAKPKQQEKTRAFGCLERESQRGNDGFEENDDESEIASSTDTSRRRDDDDDDDRKENRQHTIVEEEEEEEQQQQQQGRSSRRALERAGRRVCVLYNRFFCVRKLCARAMQREREFPLYIFFFFFFPLCCSFVPLFEFEHFFKMPSAQK